MSKRINPGYPSEIKRVPREKSRPAKKPWTFSLCYWKQIEHFGLKCSGVNEKWFVSLLDRLKDLSGLNIDEVANNPSNLWRFHPINWNQRNIPIKKTDLDWVPKEYLHEETDFFQLQISKSTGRIVGFFDSENVFQIVLLDPMHNAQPSSYNNYTINKTQEQVSTYQELQSKLIFIKSKMDKHCPAHTCEVLKLTDEVHSAHESGKHIFVNDVVSEEIEQMCREHNYDDIFDLLIDALDTLKQQKTLDNSPLNAS
jgi:hypothetical protein